MLARNEHTKIIYICILYMVGISLINKFNIHHFCLPRFIHCYIKISKREGTIKIIDKYDN